MFDWNTWVGETKAYPVWYLLKALLVSIVIRFWICRSMSPVYSGSISWQLGSVTPISDDKPDSPSGSVKAKPVMLISRTLSRTVLLSSSVIRQWAGSVSGTLNPVELHDAQAIVVFPELGWQKPCLL